MVLMRIALFKGSLYHPSSKFVTHALCKFVRHFHGSPIRYLPRAASNLKKYDLENNQKKIDDYPNGNEPLVLENDGDLFGIESDAGAICFSETVPPNMDKFDNLVHPNREDAEVVSVTPFGQIRRDIDNLPGSRRASFKVPVLDRNSRIRRKRGQDSDFKEKKSDQLTTKEEAYDLYSSRSKEHSANSQVSDTVRLNANISENEVYSTNNGQTSLISELNHSIDSSRPPRNNRLRSQESTKASFTFNQFRKQTVVKEPTEIIVQDSMSDGLNHNNISKLMKNNMGYIDECCFGDQYNDEKATFNPNAYSPINEKNQQINNRVIEEHENPADVEKMVLKTREILQQDPVVSNLSDNENIQIELADSVSYVDELYFPEQYDNQDKNASQNLQNSSDVNQQITESHMQERKSYSRVEKLANAESSNTLPDDRLVSALSDDQNYTPEKDTASRDSFIDEVYFNEQRGDRPDFLSNSSPHNQHNAKPQTHNFKLKLEHESSGEGKRSNVEAKPHFQVEDKLSKRPSKEDVEKISVLDELKAKELRERTVIIKDEKDSVKKDKTVDGSALDYVMKLDKATKIRSSVIKDGNLDRMVAEKRDSKGFRILKDQVPDLSKLTHEELLLVLKNRIIFENDDVVILDKPYNLVIHDGKTNKDPNLSSLLDSLAQSLDKVTPNPKLLTVHRLDKETTGCILLARNEVTAQHLKSLFAERKILKTYWIITSRIPEPEAGIIDIPIAEGRIGDRTRMVLSPIVPKDIKYKSHSAHGKRAVTHYQVISTSGNAALVEVRPETGIKHQIRVHFGFGLGCPILGDHKYSYLDKMAPQKLTSDLLQRLGVRQSKVRHIPIHIHARSIVIPDMYDGRNLYGYAPLPKHMVENLRSLKFRKK